MKSHQNLFFYASSGTHCVRLSSEYFNFEDENNSDNLNLTVLPQAGPNRKLRPHQISVYPRFQSLLCIRGLDHYIYKSRFIRVVIKFLSLRSNVSLFLVSQIKV